MWLSISLVSFIHLTYLRAYQGQTPCHTHRGFRNEEVSVIMVLILVEVLRKCVIIVSIIRDVTDVCKIGVMGKAWKRVSTQPGKASEMLPKKVTCSAHEGHCRLLAGCCLWLKGTLGRENKRCFSGVRYVLEPDILIEMLIRVPVK